MFQSKLQQVVYNNQHSCTHTLRQNNLPTHRSISLMIITALLLTSTTTLELLIYDSTISASHFRPRLSSLRLSARLWVSLLPLRRRAKSWLADHVTTTSQHWNIWQVWEIPRSAVSSGESGWMNGFPAHDSFYLLLPFSSLTQLNSPANSSYTYLSVCLFIDKSVGRCKIFTSLQQK